MLTTIIVLAVAGLLVLLFIGIYNRLVKYRNMKQEAWSGIDVQLKKRYDLIPNLVNTVKGYASHEKEVFENVAESRSAGIKAGTVKEQEQAENQITHALGRLFAVAENYPQLRANENFINLQGQLTKVEGDIEMARRYYNGTVRDYNIMIEQFPSNIVANMFTFKKGEFFEIEDADHRSVPQVDFS